MRHWNLLGIKSNILGALERNSQAPSLEYCIIDYWNSALSLGYLRPALKNSSLQLLANQAANQLPCIKSCIIYFLNRKTVYSSFIKEVTERYKKPKGFYFKD